MNTKKMGRIVQHIRETGPKSIPQIAEAIGISRTRAAEIIRRARRNALLKRVGKDERGSFIFGAVQTEDWPIRASDH